MNTQMQILKRGLQAFVRSLVFVAGLPKKLHYVEW